MVRVEEAEKIIQSCIRDYGNEQTDFNCSTGRVLAEPIKADRDIPPYNRVSMDGIAIQFAAFEKGVRSFLIKATQAAGDAPIEIDDSEECIEIMTGAVLPSSADTIIRYEDIDIENGRATLLTEAIKKGQNIHYKGKDKKQNGTVVTAGQIITPSIISVAASVGLQSLLVKKLPKVVIMSTGDELVDINQTPSPFQLRRSNSYAINAALQQYGMQPHLLHLPDDAEIIKKQLEHCLVHYDLVLLSGGVSMGKFDYVPKTLEALSVKQQFYKVQQKPGKPFWFGTHNHSTLVFAFPGNPVSAFMCLYRYFMPWLKSCMGIADQQKIFAVLNENVCFTPALHYFLQVKLTSSESGCLMARPIEGNGSGDFINLTEANAFMELPAEQNNFKKGEVFRVWPFKSFWS